TLTIVGGNVNVNAGGTLTLGTAASPIPAGTTAQLILAFGTFKGQYSLTVNNGGNFIVRGSTKTPSTTVSGAGNVGPGTSGGPFNVTDATGWQVGDVITIDTEAVTLTGLSGNQVTTISPGLGQVHYGTAAILVNDLSRNAVVRSSGTNVHGIGDTAYIQNLVQNATSFALTYGEFAYLGDDTCGGAEC